MLLCIFRTGNSTPNSLPKCHTWTNLLGPLFIALTRFASRRSHAHRGWSWWWCASGSNPNPLNYGAHSTPLSVTSHQLGSGLLVKPAIAVARPPFSLSSVLSIYLLIYLPSPAKKGLVEETLAGVRTGESPSFLLASRLHPPFSFGVGVVGWVENHPPFAFFWNQKGASAPFEFFSPFSCVLLAQSTDITGLISNLVLHILTRIDDTILHRLFEPKYVEVRFNKPLN